MNITTRSQSHSSTVTRSTGGEETMSPWSEPDETTLDEFLDWLKRTSGKWELKSAGSRFVITHYNEVNLATQRTVISCDKANWDELHDTLTELYNAA